MLVCDRAVDYLKHTTNGTRAGMAVVAISAIVLHTGVSKIFRGVTKTVMPIVKGETLGLQKTIPLRWIINFQKAATLPFCLFLMRRYKNESPTMMIYAALHGTYGILWLMKDLLYPDARWQQPQTPAMAAIVALMLAGYWVAPWIIAARRVNRASCVLARAVAVHTLGVFLAFVTDAQRYFTIHARGGSSDAKATTTKPVTITANENSASATAVIPAANSTPSSGHKLITDGLFRLSRNSNYLGEMMIYGSYAYLADDVAPWAILGAVWTLLFNDFISTKEESNSKKAGWDDYTRRVGRLLPFLPCQMSG